ncbi:MAG TPA: PPK2 family polyphosphate kinase [Phycisphaerae bacterium]|nr:PPK2 family polyphosphate kinase [Phycisphaerae bacterium]
MLKLRDMDFLQVKPGKKLKLKEIPSDSTKRLPDRDKADEATEECTLKMGELQDRLYAEGRRSLLVVLQGMDASGKDGTVRKVFDDVNPTGVQVISFKQPTSEELRHDFLWRCHAKTPPRGHIGVFNRSYYEDVLVVRVHQDQLLAPELRGKNGEWKRRYGMICEFERLLGDAGTRVVKFFLHISKKEQRERFIARQKDPVKHWKLAAGDFEERKFWDDYQAAYEDMLPATAREDSPWYIIPADYKWVRNYWVANIIAATLQEMDPRPPVLTDKSLITKRFK